MNDKKYFSLMRCIIINIMYKTKISKKNKIRVTVCKIRWINPITKNIQCSYGSANCNPNDRFNKTIGEKLAESRAKINLYKNYLKELKDNYAIVSYKYNTLIQLENIHQQNIKPNNN